MCIEEGCGQNFSLTDEEVEYYSGTILDKKTGDTIQMKLPKRCPKCRAKKKAERSRTS